MGHDNFDKVRFYLKKYKLIQNGPTKFKDTLCGQNKYSEPSERCNIGYSTHSCATKVRMKLNFEFWMMKWKYIKVWFFTLASNKFEIPKLKERFLFYCNYICSL